jgi:hypothetical protein
MGLHQKIVEDAGYPVLIHTEYCRSYKATHDNCFGCESEIGCKKACEVGMLFLQRANYNEKSFSDGMAADDDVARRIVEIISTKETEDFHE